MESLKSKEKEYIDQYFDQFMPEQKTKEALYPESDGKPMSDNTKQFRWIVKIKENLELLFADNPDVFIAGDLLWYPVEGNNKIRAAPDTMVAFGRPKGDRGSYLTWKEDNIAPQVVFEILSPGNTPLEMVRKFDFYERYGVEEYYLFDPDNLILKGWTRVKEKLVPVKNMQGWISPCLKIRFELRHDDLHIFFPDGSEFLTTVEMGRLMKSEYSRAEKERLRAERERLKAEKERLKAEKERLRAERLAAQLRQMGIEPDDNNA